MVAPLVIAAIISAAAAIGGAAIKYNRDKPTRRKVDTTMSDAIRARQQELLNMYTLSASGRAPSWAELSMKKALEEGQGAVASQVAQNKGDNIALAQRTGANATVAMTNKVAGQTAIARLQEQEQNRTMASDLANQMRTTDYNIENANLSALQEYDRLVAERKQQNRDTISGAVMGVGSAAANMAMNAPQSASRAGANQAAYDAEFAGGYEGASYAQSRAANPIPVGTGPSSVYTPLADQYMQTSELGGSPYDTYRMRPMTYRMRPMSYGTGYQGDPLGGYGSGRPNRGY